MLLGMLAASLLAVPSGSASPASLELQLPEEFSFAEAFLWTGHLELAEPLLTEPGFVGARSLDLPTGDLVACPIQPGSRGILPTLAALDGTCRDGVRHSNPDIRFGWRTWLRFSGALSLERAPNASMTLLTRDPTLGTVLVSVVTPEPLALRGEEEPLRFAPTVASSEVIVLTGGERFYYNGTDTAFVFDGDASGELRAAGLFGAIAPTAGFTVARAAPEALGLVLDARVLLDLQEAVLGADRREATRNATELLSEAGRVPELINGAVVGHLNGTVGGRSTAADAVTVARFDSFAAALDAGTVSGRGELRFVLSPQGFAVGGGRAASPPWLLGAALWLAALVAIRVRGPRDCTPTRVHRVAGRTVALAVALVWDLTLRGTLGTSALSLLFSGGPLGPALALLTLEASALLLAWVVVARPLNLLGRRLLPERASPWTGAAAGGVLALFLVVRTGSALALAHLFLRF